MKTKPKILYKTPDLDALAEKHQDFDGLMDAFLDEKIRKRKKLYRISSFAIVIVATAFLSWLYWGYESASSEPGIMPQQEMPSVAGEEVKKPEEVKVPEEAMQKPGPVTETVEPVKPADGQAEEERKEVKSNPDQLKIEDNELAAPSVTITRTEQINARPVKGLEDLYRYLYSEVDLPDSLMGKSGSFFLEVSFTVKENGDITEVLFNKELPQPVENEMRKIILNMPEWEPARQGEDNVESEVKLPITFQKKD